VCLALAFSLPAYWPRSGHSQICSGIGPLWGCWGGRPTEQAVPQQIEVTCHCDRGGRVDSSWTECTITEASEAPTPSSSVAVVLALCELLVLSALACYRFGGRLRSLLFGGNHALLDRDAPGREIQRRPELVARAHRARVGGGV